MSRTVVHVLSLIAAAFFAAGALRAADDGSEASFLNPFPEGELYQVAVAGDTFAEGLLAGLMESFLGDTRLNIQKRVRPLAGIMSAGFEEKAAAFEKDVASEAANILVIMVGEDDRVPLKSSSGRRVPVMSPEWRTEYARRLDRMMKAAKVSKGSVYWVGLPNFGRAEANEQAAGMNEVIRERAFQNGFRYVDAYAGFIDESGAYSAYGPDLAGKVRVLRHGDGIHFTDAGNRKLAHFVEKEMRRDLNQARAERNIPLLGDETQQAAINPENTVKIAAPASPVATDAAAAQPKVPVVQAPVADPGADQAADDGKITLTSGPGQAEPLTVDILRPAIPASVVSLMARREAGGQIGDLLVDEIAGGLTLMNSVTPSGQKGPGKTSPSQAPYFRLLVKGERLQPKPGRADDFLWQKPDASSTAPPALQPKG
jgi:hypothetical protein